LHGEKVSIKRRSVDYSVAAADSDLFRDRAIEGRSVGEGAVVGKEARVVEEIGLRKDATDRTEAVHDTVRKTEVEIEDNGGVAGRTGAGGTMGTGCETVTSTTGATSSGTNAAR
jgi:stress response protein YsnF